MRESKERGKASCRQEERQLAEEETFASGRKDQEEDEVKKQVKAKEKKEIFKLEIEIQIRW